MTERTVNLTRDQIDSAIAASRKRHAAALAEGDLIAADVHESHTNRLLDARPHHRT